MTRWPTSKESSQEESLVLAPSQVITVEHWGPQVVRESASLFRESVLLNTQFPWVLRTQVLFSGHTHL